MKRLLGACLVVATPVYGEEALSFSGFVDVAYLWNANRPASRENFVPGTGTSGKRANELTLNLAQVQWTRTATEHRPIGFTLSLVAGEGAEVVHAGEPQGGDVFRHIYQASLACRLRNGVVIEAGVYPSHIGFEGFYSKDNWNYTRSWLGELSPYYQTGIKASYAFNARWSGQLHLLNGWQIIRDNNDGKAIGVHLAYANGRLSASLNTFAGPELPDDDRSLRTLGDIVVVYRLTPRLQVGASIDVGAQELADGANATWRGIAGFARASIGERHAIAVRTEEFRDARGAISGSPQRLREATITYELRASKELILKLESRLDRSTSAVFDASDGLRERQFLALAGAVVTF